MLDITHFCPLKFDGYVINDKWPRCSKKVTSKQETLILIFVMQEYYSCLLHGHRTVSQAKNFGLEISSDLLRHLTVAEVNSVESYKAIET